MTPRISAVIPTFNRARFLVEAVKSVLRQTRAPEEIIVVDDGSTDGTERIVQPFGDHVRYFRQENLGPAAARNRGLREARGDLIAFLDSDDLWVPTKTALQVEFLSRNPEVDAVFGDMANTSDGEVNAAPEIKNVELHNYLAAHAVNLTDLFEWLIVENVVPTPTVMLRRSSVDRVGFFNEGLLVGEDLDYWLRAAASCRWGFINKVLLTRRRHGFNLVDDPIRRKLATVSVLTTTGRQLAESRPKAQELIDRKLRELNYDLGSAYLKRRDFARAYRHLKAGCPLPSKHFQWRFKVAVAWLLSRVHGRDTISTVAPNGTR